MGVVQRFLTGDGRFDTVHPRLLVKDGDGATFLVVYKVQSWVWSHGVLPSVKTISPFDQSRFLLMIKVHFFPFKSVRIET